MARCRPIEETRVATINNLLICEGCEMLWKRKILKVQMNLKGCCLSYSRLCSQYGELENFCPEAGETSVPFPD